MAISLLNEREYKITDRVTVFIPTLGEYRNKQNRPNYEMLMNFFLMTPSNYMLELHQAGRDFREVSEYEFFIENFFAFFIVDKLNGKEVKIDSTILFKDLDFRDLFPIEQENGRVVIVDKNNDIIIDEYVYMQIGALFCELLNCKKYRKKPANDIAYEYFLELEEEHRRNAHRLKRKSENEFDELIIALVCHEGFPYDFDTINNLTIYDFYCCVKQIMKWVNYTNLMRGVYSGMGTVNVKKIKKSDLNYLSFR